MPSWIVFKNYSRKRFVAISGDIFFRKGLNLKLNTGGGLAGVSSGATADGVGDTMDMDLPIDLSSGARTTDLDDKTYETTTANPFRDETGNNTNFAGSSDGGHIANFDNDYHADAGELQVTPYHNPTTTISPFPCEENCSCSAICIPIRNEVMVIRNDGRLHWRVAVRTAVKNTSIRGVGTTYDKLREYLLLNLPSRICKFKLGVGTIERHLSRKLDQGVKSGRYIINLTDECTFYRIRRKDEFEAQTKHQQLRNLMKSFKIHK